MIYRTAATMVIASALWATCSPVHATTWHLQNVSFDDLTPVSGSFEYDATTGIYSNWNINVLTGIGSLSAYTYQPGGMSMAFAHGPTWVDITAVPGIDGRLLRLQFSTGLSEAGGVIPVAVGTSLEIVNQDLRTIVAGSVAAVPEPGTWALFGLGLAVVAGAARKRRAIARMTMVGSAP